MKPFDTYGHHESGKRIKSHDLCYFTLLACVQVVVVERHRANFGLVKKKKKTTQPTGGWMDEWARCIYGEKNHRWLELGLRYYNDGKGFFFLYRTSPVTHG
jgi:hypothetical protein